jgi:hypothetical protein
MLKEQNKPLLYLHVRHFYEMNNGKYGMLDCKRALIENLGDVQKAIQHLEERSNHLFRI